MPLNAFQLAQLQELFRAQQDDLKQKVDRIVELLLGENFFTEPPIDPWKVLDEKHGISREQFDQMGVDDKVKCVRMVCKSPQDIRPEDTRAGKMIAVLDMIMQERYGWREGTVRDLTVREVLLVLEHAMEWDNPSKPSIWDITK